MKGHKSQDLSNALRLEDIQGYSYKLMYVISHLFVHDVQEFFFCVALTSSPFLLSVYISNKNCFTNLPYLHCNVITSMFHFFFAQQNTGDWQTDLANKAETLWSTTLDVVGTSIFLNES